MDLLLHRCRVASLQATKLLTVTVCQYWKHWPTFGFCKYLELVWFQPRYSYFIVVNVLKSEDNPKILEIQSEALAYDTRGGSPFTLKDKLTYFHAFISFFSVFEMLKKKCVKILALHVLATSIWRVTKRFLHKSCRWCTVTHYATSGFFLDQGF